MKHKKDIYKIYDDIITKESHDISNAVKSIEDRVTSELEYELMSSNFYDHSIIVQSLKNGILVHFFSVPDDSVSILKIGDKIYYSVDNTVEITDYMICKRVGWISHPSKNNELVKLLK